jgi:hypothetical protein
VANSEKSIEERVAATFAGNTTEHQLTILHDDGPYRHILMAKPGTGLYRYELITWPGHLAVGGDMDTYVFARVQDMFTFFRGGRVNPMYWGEKVQDGRERIKAFSEDVFKRLVKEQIGELVEKDLTEEQLEARAEILERVEDGDGYYEDAARQILSDGEQAGLLSDTWEWSLSDWDWHFLYCLNAIVAGIAAYDAAKAAEQASTASGGAS